MEQPANVLTVEDFLKSNLLQRSDVMLSRHKRAIFSKLIMWATKSLWSHAGLVFVIPKPDTGFENTFVIESVGDGVDITNLRYYLIDHADVYDVGIKRLERPWFGDDAVGVNIRKHIRGNMLNFIKAKYDMRTIWEISKMVFRKIVFGVRAGFTGLEQSVKHARDKGQFVPSQFICSGFVQYGYYETVKRWIDDDQLPAEALRDVIFNPRIGTDHDPSVLLSTTPHDIAVSEKLSWKYLIRGGLVYEVHTNEEVNALIKKKKSKG